MREEGVMAVQCKASGTTVSLVTIWLAVAAAGTFGGEIVSDTGGKDGTRSRVPAVVPVAALAAAATLFVTWFAYRSEKARARTHGLDAGRPLPEPEGVPPSMDESLVVAHG
jgi:hypothetical protein